MSVELETLDVRLSEISEEEAMYGAASVELED